MTIFPDIQTLKKAAYKKCVNGFVPKTVLVPLRQDLNGECVLNVRPGDSVREGELIASGTEGVFQSSVYAPIPGTVRGVELCVCPDGKTSSAVRIDLAGSFSYLGKKLEARPVLKSGLVSDIAEKGVLNTFTANEPRLLAEDIKNASSEKTRLLVVRLFDEDSSRLTDTLLARLFASEVFKGCEIACTALGADGIIFVVEKDFVRPSGREFAVPAAFVVSDSKKYPSGYKNQIVRAVKNVFRDDIFSKISRKSLFTDSSTMLELYRAVALGLPAIDRYVLVSGGCLNASGLIKVSIGTTFRSLSEQFGGLAREVGAVLVNGQVSGYATTSLDVPVTKYVKSVTFIPEGRVPNQKMSVCVGCGACRRVCPEGLSPDIIYRTLTDGGVDSGVYIDSARYCTNCVLCNARCPARLPLGQTIYRNGGRPVKGNAGEER